MEEAQIGVISRNLLLGSSPPVRQLLASALKVGNSRIPVLIQGESGTGKELLARAIYAAKSQGAFVPIDCGSLSPALMESELFGHERGAFTGALTQRKGLLETASGGTAFFDEIGELPLESQAKLLRALQQKEIRPIGSNRAKIADFRIIAATNRNLIEEVKCGRFRLDLYYRLNVVQLKLPPLRERKEDIPGLAQHFLQKNGHPHRLTTDVLGAMIAHSWPGNIRELENCIERLVILSSDDRLHVEDLEFHSDLRCAQSTNSAASRSHSILGGRALSATVDKKASANECYDLELSMDFAERTAILRALAESKGSMTAAAKLLGIGRTTLYRKIQRGGVKYPADSPEIS